MKTYLHSIAIIIALSSSVKLLNAQWQQVLFENDHIISLASSGNNLFAGSRSGFMYTSIDNGVQWNPDTSGLVGDSLRAIVISGDNIYAGTKEGVFWANNIGNTFHNWVFKSNGLTGGCRALAVMGNNIYSGGDDGVFLSSDSGNSWTPINQGFPLNYPNLLYCLSTSGNRLFAATMGSIFMRYDTSNSWIEVYNGWYEQIATNGNYIYAVSKMGEPTIKSSDNGFSWTPVNLPLDNYTVEASGNSIFVGGESGVFVSTDNGSNWTQQNGGFTNNITSAILIKGNEVFAGKTNGIWKASLQQLTGAYNFSIDANNGCSPLNLSITNQTTDPAAYYYQWVFMGPFQEDTLYLWDTLTTTLSQSFNFNSVDTSQLNWTSQIIVYMSAYDSLGTYLGNSPAQWVTLHPFKVVSYSIPDKCLAGLGEATATGMGTDPYDFIWSTGDSSTSNSSATISNLMAGIYTVTVTNAWGCIASDTIIVANSIPSTINFSSDPDTCFSGNGTVTSTGVGNPPYNFIWSTGDSATTNYSFTLTYLTPGIYTVTMTDSWGCVVVDTVAVENASFPPSSICMVTVDSALLKNKIIWEKQTDNPKLISYNIYKQSNTGIYNLIGNSPASALSTFIDNSSNPAQVAARYKISSLDSCSNESDLSSAHKTIHLSIGLGIPPAINLTWDSYEGINYNYFVIWRGNAFGNLVPIDTVQSTLFSYTDQNPPLGTNFYAIQIIHPQGCIPTFKSFSPYSSSFSNIVGNGYVGINALKTDVNMEVYPNPTNGKFTISGLQIINSDMITAYNLPGEEIISYTKNKITDDIIEIDFLNNPAGIYFIAVRTASGTFHKKIIKQ